MSRILLDTSAYSAFMRGHEAVRAVLQRAEAIFLNATIVGELLAGFQRGDRRRKNERELEVFLSAPRTHVLDVDRGTAERYAVILNALRKAGTPVPTNDIWIAASAMQHGVRVLTTDSDYLKIPQIIVDHFG